MDITEIKVFPVGEEKLKAFVSIVFDNCFMVNDIKVIQGRDGFFISMPSRRKKNGKFKDVAHPLNNETRQTIESQILAEYEQVVSGDGERPRFESKAPAPVEEAAVETPQAAPEPEKTEDQSVDEVAELHLRDSFWTT